jgi:condensin-2 complex subunit G2
MAKREILLAALEQSPAELLPLAANAAEALQGFSVREVERLSDAIAEHVRAALAAAAPALEPQVEGDMAETACSDGRVMRALETLTAAAAVARAVAIDPSLPVPASLSAVACALHDIIFDLHDPSASTLQAGIVSLCEAWWLADRPSRDELVPQTISYLLVSALHEQATTADVKRLWAWRGALGVLDYSDPSVGALKKLLLHCAIKPLVLRCAEGRKLLVHLFGLHPPFIADLHRAIRAQVRGLGGGGQGAQRGEQKEKREAGRGWGQSTAQLERRRASGRRARCGMEWGRWSRASSRNQRKCAWGGGRSGANSCFTAG